MPSTTSHPYRLIRTRRRSTIALTITADATLVVRAPIATSREYIERLVALKDDWIRRAMARVRHRTSPLAGVKHRASMTKAEVATYKREAKRVIPERVAFYAARFGLADAVRSVKITSAAKRWGSCTARGNLNFTWRLMLVAAVGATPSPGSSVSSALDYVVIHELAHLTHHNHSRAFWASVRAMMPDYEIAKRWLRENEGVLRAAAPKD